MDNINIEACKQAKGLAAYFEFIASESDREIWRKGLSTAQEWLRLINTKNPQPSEMLKFIGIVHANRYRTSGWHALALDVYLWLESNDIPVATRKVFFAPEDEPNNIDFFEQTSLEQANTLLAIFEEYDKKNLDCKRCGVGIEVIQKWVSIIKTQSVKRSEISALVKSVFDNQDGSNVWFDVKLAICNWCEENGYLDLVSDDYHSLPD